MKHLVIKKRAYFTFAAKNNRMNTINEITATYQRIAEEGRSELNKVQNKIYRIGSLRLLLLLQELRELYISGQAGSY